jgi:hypothetical protein
MTLPEILGLRVDIFISLAILVQRISWRTFVVEEQHE